MIERDKKLLSDIQGVAREAEQFLSTMDLEVFAADGVFVRAAERLLMIAGEASWKMSPLFRASFSGVVWADIIGMRHRLVHGYATIDPRIVFRTAKFELPALAATLASIPFFIKICGIKTIEAADTAKNAGATCLGLVLHPKSPRYLPVDEAAQFAAEVAGSIALAVLLVEPEPDQLSTAIATIRPSFVQLHGAESATRVGSLKQKGALPIIKAIGVSSAADLAQIPAYVKAADAILLDAKAPKDAAYPGGHGKAFDWSILKALDPEQPFILSGGLTPENVGEAISTIRGYGLNLIGVDVSTGVESAPGVKDLSKIEAFVSAARRAAQSGLP